MRVLLEKVLFKWVCLVIPNSLSLYCFLFIFLFTLLQTIPAETLKRITINLLVLLTNFLVNPPLLRHFFKLSMQFHYLQKT